MTAHSHFSHRKPIRPSTGRPSWWALAAVLRFVRGLLALVVLLALVAGLPWALVHFVGWPLPDHVPTWDEIQATLLNPMSAQFLLNTLAVLCWIVWFFFALDVLRCTIDAARGITWPQVRPPGPLHGLAAALIGTIVLTLLGNRAPYTAPTPTTAALTADLTPVAVVAPLTPGPATQAVASRTAATVVPATTLVIDRAAPAPPGMVEITEVVRLPHDGIYDSLWRVAERIYGPGGGSRWPELFQLNRGVEQPDGRVLTKPNLVCPGWKITAYIPASPEQHPPGEQQPQEPPPQPPPPTQPAPNTTPAPATDQAGEHSDDQAEPGLDLLTGVFVSLGLAGAITTAMVSARMWRRRRYRIGSGDRGDLQRPIAPVVRVLRAAYDHDEDSDRRPGDDVEFVDLAPAPPRIHITAAGALEPDDEPVPVPARVGVRGGRELALNLASTRGLGLAGPGATAAARALLLHLLTEQQPGNGIRVFVPTDDLHLVFDGTDVETLPSTAHVVTTLDAALDEMEAALLTRTRHAIEETETQPIPASLVLLASPAPHAERRLQAVLDNGSTLGLAGVLLGQWRPGATVRVRHDGTISATSPGIGDALADTRLFNLPATDATELLAVLRDAEGPADLTTPDYATSGVTGDEHAPPADDHDVVPTPPVPEQRSVDEMTQLESARPLEQEADEQPPPSRSLQLLDVEPIPVDVQPKDPTSASRDDTEDRRTSAEDVKPAADQAPAAVEDSPQPKNGDGAASQRPLVVRVLGRLHLALRGDEGDRELSGVLTPKQREVLVYLALHPHGVRREVLNEAVWPNSRPPRPYNSFHNTLSMLRRALADATDGRITNLVLNDDGRYQLNDELVAVDYWQLQHALQAPRPIDTEAQAQLHDAVELYQGDLAEDLLVPWIEPFREATRRDVLDALGALIRAHGDSDPETMLTLLERTRKLDRYNEGVYRDIIRTQARLDQYSAIPRTLALLTATLDEIGQHPSADTVNLADFLQRRGSARRPVCTDNAAAS
ncbi:BTAD domain-containing putative transcriptional regulator [Kibdelosporangium persicum]|uniref:Response regulator receiver n=1 Tax=Kibdelosporangium persicum TaxID=2698649 RepID=A0ABX2FCW4_9PSEU|nr:BTAD domain-containing putative transcriptional regulator [Kibdelosporangium persicum]NRN69201.1 Response regulator receiver [Kibdelosporangium persicum]